MARISFADKEDLNTISKPRKNKVIAQDINDIKNSINFLYDTADGDKGDVTVSGSGTVWRIATALKTAWDSAVTWINTNGTNILDHIASTLNPHNVTKTQVGLSNVDNTSDVNKPVSTLQQTALNLKANVDSPTFTGTVSGITKAMVGLSAVPNTDTSTTANITDSSNKRFITDAQQTVLENTSGINTGDNAVNSNYSGLIGRVETLEEAKILSLTSSERNAIISPSEALIVYDNTLKVLMVFDGINWISL